MCNMYVYVLHVHVFACVRACVLMSSSMSMFVYGYFVFLNLYVCLYVHGSAWNLARFKTRDPCRRDRPLRDTLLCNSAGCNSF